jgi:hypothetical protein
MNARFLASRLHKAARQLRAITAHPGSFAIANSRKLVPGRLASVVPSRTCGWPMAGAAHRTNRLAAQGRQQGPDPRREKPSLQEMPGMVFLDRKLTTLQRPSGMPLPHPFSNTISNHDYEYSLLTQIFSHLSNIKNYYLSKSYNFNRYFKLIKQQYHI